MSEEEHLLRRKREAFASFQVPSYLEKTELIYFNEMNNSTVVQARDPSSGSLYAIKRIPGVCTLELGHCRNVVRELVVHLWLTHESGFGMSAPVHPAAEKSTTNTTTTDDEKDEEEEEEEEEECGFNSNNIVPLLDVYLSSKESSLHRGAGRDIYLVMPFVSFDLVHVLASSTLKEPEIREFALQLLQGVKQMHDKQLLHRDLSLANILISNRGELLLSDFGLSRCKDAQQQQQQCGEDSVEEGTTSVVTIEYRAPELLLRYKKYDSRVDIWSVGCVIAEMFVRKRIFLPKKRDDLHQLSTLICIGGHPPLSTIDDLGAGTGAPAVARTLIEQVAASGQLRPQYEFLREVLSEAGASADAIDFITTLLTFDFRQRPDAATALRHRWLSDPEEGGDHDEDGEGKKEDDISNSKHQEQVQQDEDDEESDESSCSNHHRQQQQPVAAAGEVEDQASRMLAQRCSDGGAGADSAGSSSCGMMDSSCNNAKPSSSSEMTKELKQQEQQQKGEGNAAEGKDAIERAVSDHDLSWSSQPVPADTSRDAVDSGNVDLIEIQTMKLPELVKFLEQLCVRASDFCTRKRQEEAERTQRRKQRKEARRVDKAKRQES